MHIIRTLYMYVGKEVGIRGYFSKTKGVHYPKSLGNTALGLHVLSR